MIVVVTALVLLAKVMNSAIEALCDFVETRHDERIRVIKDSRRQASASPRLPGCWCLASR
ncbi:MAG: diacylglycerol kinase [Rubrivivax sp.]|nr:diacylglycerol kinase [Rubrivivax sp.]MBK7262369.1 diacylglycerol kinase [Rubrivivax sp.]MBK8528592.1 diacylglycerol kinase [Rubrivivax sp.]